MLLGKYIDTGVKAMTLNCAATSGSEMALQLQLKSSIKGTSNNVHEMGLDTYMGVK